MNEASARPVQRGVGAAYDLDAVLPSGSDLLRGAFVPGNGAKAGDREPLLVYIRRIASTEAIFLAE